MDYDAYGGDILAAGEALLEEMAARDIARKRASALRAAGSGFTVVSVKDAGDGRLTITGTASTSEIDRMGDIVEPRGCKFALPLPFLLSHDHTAQIGQVTSLKITDRGVDIVAAIFKGLSDRIDEAARLIQAGMYGGLSIGFRGLKSERITETGGLRFTSWELLEVSAVAVPANASGKIAEAKRWSGKEWKTDKSGMVYKGILTCER